MAKTRLVIRDKMGFYLTTTSKSKIESLVRPIVNTQPNQQIDVKNGYLPEAIWGNTRGYIEKIASQVNGCYQCGFYDAASVLLRRLIETLIIECYEHEKTGNRIKDQDNNYQMLSGLITDAVDRHGLSLGRETKRVLKTLKTVGDRAAHNRRYNAVQADLANIQIDVRLAVDELIQLSELKR